MLREFLTQLHLNGVVLVGWSLGAIVSWEYVDQFGTDRIRALVDIDMEPSPLKREDYDCGTYTVEGLADALGRLQTDPTDLIEQNIEALLKDPPSRELQTMMFDEDSRTSPLIQAAMLLGLLRDYRDMLPNIDIPTLVCAGADEKWRTVAAVEYATELIPDSRFERFEDSGHCITVEEPDRFNQVLSDFVDSL
ncbi:alpha/beta fold hydrolase [Natrinema gelatinilyticum]|uniref:alpha/beta fold hydrolase n=1 Tax=Natrinema gelatinilyticum TaxID=2961571 RepID=UPI0020C4D3AF|nr:alpha/beta hydrolase [Natrinema gelatinilyticum]